MNANKKLRIEIGRRFRKIREYLGLPQSKISSLLYISRSSYSKYEEGINFPSIGILKMMVDELNVSLDWLICERGWMFNEVPKESEGKDNGSFEAELKELVYLMNHVPLVRHSVMGYFQRFKLDNRDEIEMVLQKLKSASENGSSSDT